MKSTCIVPAARSETVAAIRGVLYDPGRCPDADLGLDTARQVLKDPSLKHANLDERLTALDEFTTLRLLNRLRDRFPEKTLLHRRLALMRILQG